ncbi:MAG: ABC transporter permease [Candidatus Eremiobacteraeota bacterium]|nr:ABC transporter permease [Candidatus Eremiobacteraeota bacterium]
MAQAEVEAKLADRADVALQRARRAALLRSGGALVALLVVVVIVDYLTHGDFLTAGNITNVLRQITYNTILAVGQTFVIITAGIDLSVGSLVALAGVVCALFANAVPLHGDLLLVATLVIALALGAFAGFVNAVPVVKLGLPPFITTLAMMQIARGFAYIFSSGRPVALSDNAGNAFANTGIGYVLSGLLAPLRLPGIPIAVIWMAIVVVVFAVLLSRTRFGRYVYAIGGNEEAARLAGVSVGLVKTAVYMISGALAAVGGMLLMARFSSGSPQTGTGFELNAIAAVVVGGTSLMGGRGTVVGTFFGALLIGVLNNVMNLIGIESYTQQIVLGVVIVTAVIIDELRKRYLAARR